MSDHLSLFFDETAAVVVVPGPPDVPPAPNPPVQPSQSHLCWICRRRSAVGTEECPHWCMTCTRAQGYLWRQMWGQA